MSMHINRAIINPNTDLSLESVLKAAPSVYTTTPKANLTKDYAVYPTIDVVHALHSEGWMPVWARQHKVRTMDKMGFQKHMIRFRRIEDVANMANSPVETSFPELVLVNSHDGTTSYQLHAGLFRLVCSNGLIVADGTFNKIRIKHMGFKLDNVIEASYKVLKAVPELASQIDAMRSITLSEDDKLDYAGKALKLRYDNPEITPVAPKDLLTIKRSEDDKSDLWTVTNVLQENLLRGGLKNSFIRNANGKEFRRTREVKSLDDGIRINKELWHLASEYTNKVA